MLFNGEDELYKYVFDTSKARSILLISLLDSIKVFSVFCWVTQSAIAGNSFTPSLPAEKEKVVEVRGKESVVQELNMGPDATDLWRKIQQLIATPKVIADFSKLVSILNLSITDPIDSVSPAKPGLQWRYDAKIEPYRYMVERISYSILNDNYDINGRAAVLVLFFSSEGSCITSSEVRRVYGGGSIGTSVHSRYRPSSGPDTAGLMFSESYKEQSSPIERAELIFNYRYNGCVREITVSQRIIE